MVTGYILLLDVCAAAGGKCGEQKLTVLKIENTKRLETYMGAKYALETTAPHFVLCQCLQLASQRKY